MRTLATVLASAGALVAAFGALHCAIGFGKQSKMLHGWRGSPEWAALSHDKRFEFSRDATGLVRRSLLFLALFLAATAACIRVAIW